MEKIDYRKKKIQQQAYENSIKLSEKGYVVPYNTDKLKRELYNKEAIPYYLINNKGEIYSFATGTGKKIKPIILKNDRCIINIKTNDSPDKRKQVLFKTLMYITFKKENYEEVISGKMSVVQINGNNADVSLNNLIAVNKGELPPLPVILERRKNFKLPENAVVLNKKKKITVPELPRTHVMIKGFYYKVYYFGKGSAGVLGVRMAKEEVPEYYNEYLKAKNMESKGNYQTVPLSTVFMHEQYNEPRPSVLHRVKYIDGNPMNLEKENLAWEIYGQFFQRVHNGVLNKKHKYKEYYEKAEESYFLKEHTIRLFVRKEGLSNNAYYAIYRHIKAVKDNPEMAVNEKVKEMLMHRFT